MASNKYVPETPDFTKLRADMKGYEVYLYNLLSFVNYEVDDKELVKAAKKWIKNNTEVDSSVLFKLPETYFMSVGKFCFILNRGGELNEKLKTTMNNNIVELYNHALRYSGEKGEKEELKETPVKKVNIQDYMKEKAIEVAGEIESWIDDFHSDPKSNPLNTKDIKGLCTSNNLKAGHMRILASLFEFNKNEIEKAITEDDSDLKEGYSHLTKSNLKQLLAFYKEIETIAGEFKTKTTKVKPKKAIDKNKMVSKLPYLEKDSKLGLQSMHPVHIIGANAVWYYRVDARKLGVYYASDVTGLIVSGSSIKNFSDKSGEKTIRTSANVDIKKLVKMKNADRQKVFEGIKCINIRGSGRFNDNIIILAIEK